MINVSKPFLPPKSDYTEYIDGVFKRAWLTNNGPLVNELELKLKDYLGVRHLLYTNNGTIALQLAIKALNLSGEILTTPFSYVATSSSIVWEGCTPVFVDIDENSLNIDPSKLENSITDKTKAILATHVYGNPCNIEAINFVAKKNNLKVIYDAAHCFGTNYRNVSVFNYGDIATTSFHATKLFHTIEGGAIFSNDAELIKKLAYMRNFGHETPESFADLGINGKNSEFHAAMGLCNLKYISEILEKRRQLFEYYDNALTSLRHRKPEISDLVEYNYAYYPIILESEEFVLKVIANLNGNQIFPRRYFYPSLNTCLPYINKVAMPISDEISKCVITLPLYHDLSYEEIDFIARIILRTQNN